MADETQNLTIRTLAEGATAQLRVIAKSAPRDEARRLHAELTRIATELARKHEFGVFRKVECDKAA